MTVLRLETARVAEWERPVVATIGNFDGVHRGHQALIATAVAQARAGGGTPVVLTFDPHPARLLNPAAAPSSLMTLDQRAEAMAEIGVSHVVAVTFDRRLAAMDGAEFSSRVLRETLSVGVVVVGETFRFGRGRAADVDALRALGPGLGFQVVAVPPILHEGRVVSSSRVREALARGDVVGARGLLGRRFFLDGRVIAGDGRGRTLGVPTANLELRNETLPALGVYAGWCSFEGAPRPAVVNVGRRPTFGGETPVVEAHLLDWAGDLYGREMRLAFERRLREERRFPDREALVRQIRADIAEARGVLVKA